MGLYRTELSARLDPSADLFHRLTAMVRAKPKRVVFAEGEESSVVRAAVAFQQAGLGKAVLVGRTEVVKSTIQRAGLEGVADLEIRVPHSAAEAAPYIDALYKRLQRRGALYRDCVRLVTNDRNIYAASLLAAGEVDAMVTGATRAYGSVLGDIRRVLDATAGQHPIGVMVIFAKGRVIFAADTSVHEMPTSEQLADIAVQAARVARWFGHTPRLALLASSTFGYPRSERSERIVEAVNILDRRQVDFEYDGELAADVALDREKMALYPFCRLSDTANVLVMPAVHSAQIATKLLSQVGGVSMLGPFLVGLEKPVQIVSLGAAMTEIYNAALVASL
jgi:malate dehydrogenase (oxaloacetate-decarboxylating)(NADP+)